MSTTPTADGVGAAPAKHERGGAAPAAPPGEGGPRTGGGAGAWLRGVVLRPDFALPIVTLLLFLYLTFANEFFFSERNLLNITQAVAIVGIAAAFATIVVIAGGIDLSPVVIFIMSGLVSYWALNHGLPVPVAIVVAIAAGGAIGLMNGLLIAVGNLNPFIVTLGTNFLFTGLAFVLTDGEALVIEDDGFRDLGRTDVIGDLSTTTVVMAASFAAAF